MNYLKNYESRVEDYCIDNGLDYSKLLSCSFGKGKNNFSFSHYEGNFDDSVGLLDDTPMPCVLWVDINYDGSLDFTKTEFTEQYLAI
jgi:hypothetical protein